MSIATKYCPACGADRGRHHAPGCKISNADKQDRAARQAKFRQQQRRLGRRGRLYYLTDEEKSRVDEYLSKLRAATVRPVEE